MLFQSPESSRETLAVLLYALLCKYSMETRLLPSAVSQVFQDLSESVQQTDEVQPKASTSRTPSPSSSISESTPSSPFANVLLDVIWSVDVEIDSRNDYAGASGSTTLSDDSKSTERALQGTLEEQTSIAKSRLAKVVGELLVSSTEGQFSSQRLTVSCPYHSTKAYYQESLYQNDWTDRSWQRSALLMTR
jgi:hypothetical protein